MGCERVWRAGRMEGSSVHEVSILLLTSGINVV